MEPWERVERKVDRLTWIVCGYLLYKLSFVLVAWWNTIFWCVCITVGLYLLLLTPVMRAMFPTVGKQLLQLNRWLLRKALGTN